MVNTERHLVAYQLRLGKIWAEDFSRFIDAMECALCPTYTAGTRPLGGPLPRINPSKHKIDVNNFGVAPLL